MARQFTFDNVDLGQPTNITFDKDSDWSVFIIFKINSQSGVNHLYAKSSGNASKRQMQAQIVNTQELRVRMGDSTKYTSSSVSTGVWYLWALVNDGTSNNFETYIYNVESKSLFASDLSNASADATTNDRDVMLGRQFGSTPQSLDDTTISHWAYIHNVQLTQGEVIHLMYEPRSIIARHGAESYLELGSGSPEPDFSGNGNTGTVTGTVIADGPPLGSRKALIIPPPAPAVGGGLSIPVAMHNYRRRRLCS